MENKYVSVHNHTFYSNSILLDSTSSPLKYVNRAKELGLNGIIFTEHGNAIEWKKKYDILNKNSMKYVHASEMYICDSIESKDSYHILVYAKNYNGFKELNKLITKAYQRDGHFYSRPRITPIELCECNNLIISTACANGIISQECLSIFNHLTKNFNGEIFAEIQPHNHEIQIKFNEKVIEIARKNNLKLIASNDVHNATKDDEISRSMLQKQNGINFSDEDSFEIILKSYEEMIESFLECGVEYEISVEAMNNTNLLFDMCDSYSINCDFKYPNLYDNPYEEIVSRCYSAINKLNLTSDEYLERLMYELTVMKKLGAYSYMLLASDWITQSNIRAGISRGSASGSLVAFLLGITQVDPLIFNFNFYRFMNEDRVSLMDIDVDHGGEDKRKSKKWLYNHPKLSSADIITFGTFGEKSSIEAICRIKGYDNSEYYKNMSSSERDNHSEFFNEVEMMNGCVRSIGRHPAGVCIHDEDLSESIGLITMLDKETGEYVRVTQLDMKSVESLGYLKMDVLGLDNIGAINETYDSIGLERPTPQDIDYNDDNVWNDIIKSPFGIFQFENPIAHGRLSTALSNITGVNRLKIMSLMSSLVRPAGASIVEQYQSGKKFVWGHDAIDNFYKDNLGYCVEQEDQMNFLVNFCGYTGVESDHYRKKIAKKGLSDDDADKLIKEIKERFMNYFPIKYDCDLDLASDIVDKFCRIAYASKDYSFSYNHSMPYTITGYMCAWLRCYYPKEYITATINTFIDDHEKVKSAYQYIKDNTNITIQKPKLGFSSLKYSFDKNSETIYEGLGSYKSLSSVAVENISKLESADKFDNDFIKFLIHISECQIQIGYSNIKILIETDFFRDFGLQESLLKCAEMFFLSKKYDFKQKEKTKESKIKFYYEQMNEIGWSLDRHNLYKAYSELLIKNSTDIDVDVDASLFYVSNYEKKFNKFILSGYNLKEKCNQTWWCTSINFSKGDMIQLLETEIKPKKRKVDGKWVTIEDEFNYNLKESTVIFTQKKQK